jgi:hypothetical protein
MKDCFYQYRKGLYEALTASITYGGSAVPVMEYASLDQATPYIQILGMNSQFSMDHDNFSQEVVTDIQVVTSHVGEPEDFGSKQSDDIMNDIMELLITKGVTAADRAKHITMTDFTDAGCYFDNLAYQSYYDGQKVMIIKVLTIRTLIDED